MSVAPVPIFSSAWWRSPTAVGDSAASFVRRLRRFCLLWAACCCQRQSPCLAISLPSSERACMCACVFYVQSSDSPLTVMAPSSASAICNAMKPLSVSALSPVVIHSLCTSALHDRLLDMEYHQLCVTIRWPNHRRNCVRPRRPASLTHQSDDG